MDQPLARYAAEVRHRRNLLGLTQERLAHEVLTSPSHLSEVLSGKRPLPPLLAQRIADRLDPDGDVLPAMYAEACPSPNGHIDGEGHWGLPRTLLELLGTVRRAIDDQPYPSRSAHRPSITEVYVRQTVAAMREPRRWRDTERDEPVIVEPERQGARLTEPFDEVLERHEHLVVQGAAGLGKSTLGRQLVLDCVAALLDGSGATPADRALIPLMIPARVLAAELRPDRNWRDVLHAAVVAEYCYLADTVIPPALLNGPVSTLRWLVVVDALDEVPDLADRERLLGVLAARISASSSAARFVVTTRPLSPGEVSRLLGPRVGFYELQPFDRASLERYARRRFAAEGAPTAAEFLRQVTATGLENVLTVPLLAAVAADVFENERRHQLPASRFELFQTYMETFHTPDRSVAATEDLQTVRLMENGPPLADYLSDSRTEILERLATAYTTSETALIDIVRQMVLEHASPPARLPQGWEDPVARWLAHTGVLTYNGVRLRFLHQTFAEHLAATAAARRLPASFDPENESWRDVLRGLLLGDEAAVRVAAHHLHLEGRGAPMLSTLQRGTRDERDAALRLIGQGAPGDENQMAAALDWAVDCIHADRCPEVDHLIRIGREPAARDRLIALLREEETPAATRVTLAALLRDGPAVDTLHGVAALDAIIAGPHDVGLRRDAAAAMVRLGGTHQEEGAAALRTLAANRNLSAWARIQIILELVQPELILRDEAAVLLRETATEPSADGWDQRHVAVELAKLGGEHRIEAVRILTALCTNALMPFSYRLDAAKALPEIGPNYREDAIALLDRLASDPDLPDDQARAAAATALSLRPDHGAQAARRWLDLLNDTNASPWSRQMSAQELVKLGSEYRSTAAEMTIRAAMSDTASLPMSRQMLVEAGRIGPRWHQAAAEAMLHLATNRYASSRQTLLAAVELSRMGNTYHARAGELFSAIARNPMMSVPDRRDAALEAAKLGQAAREQVSREYRNILATPVSTPAERILAAVVLAALNPTEAQTTVQTLTHYATSGILDDEARLAALRGLVESGTHHLGQALEVRSRILRDRAASYQVRANAAILLADQANTGLSLANFYHAVAADPTEDRVDRREAAVSLTELGEDQRRSAARLVRIMANDTTQPDWYRAWIAEALTQAGESRQALDTLHRVASDPMITSGVRGEAAEALAKHGEAERAQCAALLEQIASDPRLKTTDVIDTAVRLRKVTGAVSPQVHDLVKQIRDDALAAPADRFACALMLAEEEEGFTSTAFLESLPLDDLDFDELDDVLDAVRKTRFAENAVLREMTWKLARNAQPWIRLKQCKWIAQLDEESRRAAHEIVIDMVADSALSADERVSAARYLANHQQEAHPRLVQLTRSMVEDTALQIEERITAAELHLRLDPESVTVPSVLLGLITDSLIALGPRFRAAELLVRLGARHAATAIEAARSLTTDAYATPGDRALAATILTLGDPAVAPAVALATEFLMHAPNVSSKTRIEFAILLSRLGPNQRDHAVHLLGQALTDPWLESGDLEGAVMALARWGDDERELAVRLSEGIAAHAGRDCTTRRTASWLALQLDGESAQRVTEQLLGFGADPTVEFDDRLEALAKAPFVDLGRREEMVESLRALAGEPNFPHRRVRAVEKLNEMDPSTYPNAATLLAIGSDVTKRHSIRRWSANLLTSTREHRADCPRPVKDPHRRPFTAPLMARVLPVDGQISPR